MKNMLYQDIAADYTTSFGKSNINYSSISNYNVAILYLEIFTMHGLEPMTF